MFSGLNLSPVTIGLLVTLAGLLVLVFLIIKVQTDIKKDVEAWKEKTKPLETVAGKHFINQVIVLDGKRWVDCVFENCTLKMNGESFYLVGSQAPNSMWQFGDKKLVQFIQLLKMLGFLEKNFADGLRFGDSDMLEKGFSYEKQGNKTDHLKGGFE